MDTRLICRSQSSVGLLAGHQSNLPQNGLNLIAAIQFGNFFKKHTNRKCPGSSLSLNSCRFLCVSIKNLEPKSKKFLIFFFFRNFKFLRTFGRWTPQRALKRTEELKRAKGNKRELERTRTYQKENWRKSERNDV